jgi:hypothetical protein
MQEAHQSIQEQIFQHPKFLMILELSEQEVTLGLNERKNMPYLDSYMLPSWLYSVRRYWCQ